MNLGFFIARFTGKILIALVSAMIVCGVTPTMDSRAYAAVDEWDEVFDTARAVLAKLPDPARIEATIKDAGLREAVLRAYRSVKACAKVNKQQSPSQKRAFVAEFERAFVEVQKEAERGDYQTCAVMCKSESAKCVEDCASAKKKLCGCKLTEFGCFVRQCLFP